MARYQVLFWRHIPLGVKATDINRTVRVNLPTQFQEMFQQAASQNRQAGESPYTTSGFRWTDVQEREGSASQVAAAVAQALAATWDEQKALAAYEKYKGKDSSPFIDLKKLFPNG